MEADALDLHLVQYYHNIAKIEDFIQLHFGRETSQEQKSIMKFMKTSFNPLLMHSKNVGIFLKVLNILSRYILITKILSILWV